MSKNAKFEAYQKKLHAMRSRLDARVGQLHDEALHGSGGEQAGDLSSAPIHLADLGGQEAEAVVNLRLASNEAALRREIDDALERFDTGTFAICEECRGEIETGRLNAVPYSRFCIQCAKRGS